MSFPRISGSLLSIALIIGCFTAVFAFDDEFDWKPITKAELEMTKPVVDPDADAEAIFWEVVLDDKKRGKMTLYHYVRVKIFTERGREKFAKFDIPFTKRTKVENVDARVIKPDGTIVNLNPNDIFEREIIRAGKLRINAKSFAVPGIEPGVIVEYRYEENRKGDSVSGKRLLFQRDIPMQRISYFIRPFKGSAFEYKYYNMQGDSGFQDSSEREGFSVLTRTNVPAFKEEPYMPPDDEVRKWVYVTYSSFRSTFQWALFGESAGVWFDDVTKPNKEVKQLAERLVSGTSTDEEKLRRLYRYVQKEIRNISFDPNVTEEELEKIKLKDADDVLERSAGTSQFVDLLFASLARALGYEASLALTGDRSEQFFSPERYRDIGFIHPCCVAVKTGGSWNFYNPGAPYLPFGKLIWYEESVSAMLVNGNGFGWSSTPASSAAETRSVRSAKLRLDEDGNIEGDLKFEFDGHTGALRRLEVWTKSDEKRKEEFENEVKERFALAEISEMTISNFEDASKPLTYNFRIKIPGYASKTGKRLIIRPGLFEYEAKPPFTSDKREHDIYFPYGWSEMDDVELNYPEGYAPENLSSPGDLVDNSGVAGQTIRFGVVPDERLFVYSRRFYFGEGANFFRGKTYKVIKDLFDLVNKNDQTPLTLKKIEEQ